MLFCHLFLTSVAYFRAKKKEEAADVFLSLRRNQKTTRQPSHQGKRTVKAHRKNHEEEDSYEELKPKIDFRVQEHERVAEEPPEAEPQAVRFFLHYKPARHKGFFILFFSFFRFYFFLCRMDQNTMFPINGSEIKDPKKQTLEKHRKTKKQIRLGGFTYSARNSCVLLPSASATQPLRL